jgi:hypothetical protein
MTHTTNIDQFLSKCLETAPGTRINIDRRFTIEVGFRSEFNRHGEAEIVPAGREVVPVARFIRQPGRVVVQTESGDIWPFAKHKQPGRADLFALPIR